MSTTPDAPDPFRQEMQTVRSGMSTGVVALLWVWLLLWLLVLAVMIRDGRIRHQQRQSTSAIHADPGGAPGQVTYAETRRRPSAHAAVWSCAGCSRTPRGEERSLEP